MNDDPQRLYDLLPSIYRMRDAAQGGPVRDLLAIIAEQVAVLHEELAQLYDDQFIETCAPWAIPYLGDLIGYRTLDDLQEQNLSFRRQTMRASRAEVANTIAHRRRKGTAAQLEQLARDVTGWPARVVEFFQHLATTQYMNHLRPTNLATPDLRQMAALRHIGTPFDRVTHRPDVRRIASGRGQHNIPNIGIFLWRLRAYPVEHGTARQIQPGLGCYTFDPGGRDLHLFNRAQTEDQITQLAAPINVPEPLRSLALYRELEARRQAIVDEQSSDPIYFGPEPVFALFLNGASTPIPPEQILICDLSDPPAPIPTLWHRPPPTITYQSTDPTKPAQALQIRVAVDPVLGRIAFPDDTALDQIEVSYSYGFSADLGGGPYARRDRTAPSDVVRDFPQLQNILNTSGAEPCVIEIPHSRILDGNLLITLNEKQKLRIQAADAQRPVLNGSITIQAAVDAELVIDGLWIAGGITITGTMPIALELRDCTIPPWRDLIGNDPQLPSDPSIKWRDAAARGTLTLMRTICGRVRCPTAVDVTITTSIIDALADTTIALAANEDGSDPCGDLAIRSSTIRGGIHAREVDLIENSIITGRVLSDRTQAGCVRFSYLPRESRVPRRYECQPDRAVEQALTAARQCDPELGSTAQDAIERAVNAHLTPSITDTQHGRAPYMQLAQSCAVELHTGADNGGELGAFHDLFQTQRTTNLQLRLDEYLRFGLEAGLIYVT